MFTRIVVPLDGSQVAARALGYAIALAEQFHAALTLVGVLAPTQDEVFRGAVFGVASTGVRAASAEAEATMTDYLEGVAAPLRARGIACDIATPRGNPAEEIIAAAGNAPGTLIVMSTHGRTGFERWRLGSVAQHVMRHAAVPTFVVRAQEEDVPQLPLTIAEITVTLDGSLLAEKALPAATALADAFAVPLVLFSVLPSTVYPESEQAAGKYHARVVASTATPTRTVRSVWRHGVANHPESVISEYLADRPPGIVVLASHGRGGIRRWALGSTAEGMLVHSPQPVLVVRAGTMTTET